LRPTFCPRQLIRRPEWNDNDDEENIKPSQVWQGCRKESRKCHAPGKARHSAIGKRRSRREGEKPQTGNRDWTVGGAQEGREGSEEEIVKRRPHTGGDHSFRFRRRPSDRWSVFQKNSLLQRRHAAQVWRTVRQNQLGDCQPSGLSLAFEILHGPLVCFGRLTRAEGPEIAPLSRLRILLS
jgi:hypothetical protein